MDIVDYRPETAMVIFAHPDDAEIGSGGTVSKWSKNGTQLHLCNVLQVIAEVMI